MKKKVGSRIGFIFNAKIDINKNEACCVFIFTPFRHCLKSILNKNNGNLQNDFSFPPSKQNFECGSVAALIFHSFVA